MRATFRHYCDAILRLTRAGLLFVFDSAVLLGCRRKREKAGAIFCLHGLGDLTLAGNAITALASQLRAKGLKVALFVGPKWVEFARRYFEVDEVEGIDRHRFSRHLGYRRVVLKSVANRFELAVQPMYNRMLRVEDFLMRATGASERIGSEGHAPFISRMERWLGNRCYTKIIPAKPLPMHELERQVEFMAGLGFKISNRPWKLRPVRPASQQPVIPIKDYLMLAPDASDRRRTWPLDNFMRAAHEIATKHDLAVLIVGEEADGSGGDLSGEPAERRDWVDLRGKIPTDALPDVLADAKLILSNDSGILHLGISLGRPTVAIGGSGIPARYFPYREEPGLNAKVIYRPVPCAGCNWRCIHTVSRAEPAWCLAQVSWQEVAATAHRFLEEPVRI